MGGRLSQPPVARSTATRSAASRGCGVARSALLLLVTLSLPSAGQPRIAPFVPTRGGKRVPRHQVRIGVLLPIFRGASVSKPFQLDAGGTRRLAAFEHALREINNKTDGFWDDLLPNTDLMFAFHDSRR